MTAAGLCWVALEALDVHSGDANITNLARALSLQALRQQILDLHQRTRSAVTSMLRVAREAHSAAQRKFHGAAARAVAAVGGIKAELAQQAVTAQAAALNLSAGLDLARAAEEHQAKVDAWTGVGNDGKLRDLNRWLDLLVAPADAEPRLRTAADAITALDNRLGGETGTRLRAWRALLADPKSLAEWLEDTTEQFAKSLKWLYALRNTALHDGQFTSATDDLDIQAGRALVDLTLEFLGNWYEHAAPDRADWPASKVINHLAARQKDVVRTLRHETRTNVDATYLTSPTSTGWRSV
jgi:hypothetical protein